MKKEKEDFIFDMPVSGSVTLEGFVVVAIVVVTIGLIVCLILNHA